MPDNTPRKRDPNVWTSPQNETESREITGPVPLGWTRIFSFAWRSAIDVYVRDRDGVFVGSSFRVVAESGGLQSVIVTAILPAIGDAIRLISERTIGADKLHVEMLTNAANAGAVLWVSTTVYGREPAASVVLPNPVGILEATSVFKPSDADVEQFRYLGHIEGSFASVRLDASRLFVPDGPRVTNPFEDSVEFCLVPDDLADPRNNAAIIAWMHGIGFQDWASGFFTTFQDSQMGYVCSYGGLPCRRWGVWARPGMRWDDPADDELTVGVRLTGDRYPVVGGSAPGGAWSSRTAVPPAYVTQAVGVAVPNPLPLTSRFPNASIQTCRSPAVWRSSGSVLLTLANNTDIFYAPIYGGPWRLKHAIYYPLPGAGLPVAELHSALVLTERLRGRSDIRPAGVYSPTDPGSQTALVANPVNTVSEAAAGFGQHLFGDWVIGCRRSTGAAQVFVSWNVEVER